MFTCCPLDTRVQICARIGPMARRGEQDLPVATSASHAQLKRQFGGDAVQFVHGTQIANRNPQVPTGSPIQQTRIGVTPTCRFIEDRLAHES